MVNDLKSIKKYYGEDMMHFCRLYFAKLLDDKGYLINLLLRLFEPNKFLYKDIVEEEKISNFVHYIFYNSLINEEFEDTTFTPFELMDKVNYKLYKCESEEDIQSFKHYYKKGEELCTFEGGRLKGWDVFFAVKKDADYILRKNFKKPKREDDYGISVISIQFSHLSNIVSIKNRYNHKVDNPDNTFECNLDNIAPGLTKSFINYYGYNLSTKKVCNFELKNYIKLKDGKFYKYNYEINNTYYCPNNLIIKDTNIVKDYTLKKEQYIVLDYLLVDLHNKRISLLDNKINDTIINRFIDINNKDEKNNNLITDIKLINNKEKQTKTLIINTKDNSIIYIEFDKENKMIGYSDDNINYFEDNYLYNNYYLENISTPNVTSIGDNVLYNNRCLKKYENNKVLKIGKSYLFNNDSVEEIIMDNVIKIDDNYMSNNSKIKRCIYPSLEYAGNNFLSLDTKCSYLYFPLLEYAGDDFLAYSKAEKLDFSSLKFAGNNFINYNEDIKYANFNCLEIIGYNFLENAEKLEEIKLNKLRKVSKNCLKRAIKLKKIYLKNVTIIEDDLLSENKELIYLYCPNVKKIGSDMLANNNTLENVEINKCISIDDCFLKLNKCLKRFKGENIVSLGDCCLYFNNDLKSIYLPNLEHVGRCLLAFNKTMKNATFKKGKVYSNEILLSNTTIDKNSFMIIKHKNKILSKIFKR